MRRRTIEVLKVGWSRNSERSAAGRTPPQPAGPEKSVLGGLSAEECNEGGGVPEFRDNIMEILTLICGASFDMQNPPFYFYIILVEETWIILVVTSNKFHNQPIGSIQSVYADIRPGGLMVRGEKEFLSHWRRWE